MMVMIGDEILKFLKYKIGSDDYNKLYCWIKSREYRFCFIKTKFKIEKCGHDYYISKLDILGINCEYIIVKSL
jgi:hypothetical protein